MESEQKMNHPFFVNNNKRGPPKCSLYKRVPSDMYRKLCIYYIYMVYERFECKIYTFRYLRQRDKCIHIYRKFRKKTTTKKNKEGTGVGCYVLWIRREGCEKKMFEI